MKLFLTIILATLCVNSYAQVDVISQNIFQNTNRLGIGIETPNNLLHIQSNEGRNGTHPRQFLLLENLNNSSHSNVAIALKSGLGEMEGSGSFGVTSKTYTAAPNLGGYTYVFDRNNGIAIRSVNENGIIKFITGGGELTNERMIINATGDVGIGTTTPAAKLHVADGDIYISEIGRGIIMKSPDGNCWRGVVNNQGAFNFSPIDCPEEGFTSGDVDQLLSKPINIALYPNPTGDFIQIQIKEITNKLAYKIYAINGTVKQTGILQYHQEMIDISGYESGSYIVEIIDTKENRRISKKVIKQ